MPVDVSVSVTKDISHTTNINDYQRLLCPLVDGLAVSVPSVGWGRAYSLPCKDGRLYIKLSPDTSADVSSLDFIDTGTEIVVVCVAAESYKHAMKWIINWGKVVQIFSTKSLYRVTGIPEHNCTMYTCNCAVVLKWLTLCKSILTKLSSPLLCPSNATLPETAACWCFGFHTLW